MKVSVKGICIDVKNTTFNLYMLMSHFKENVLSRDVKI